LYTCTHHTPIITHATLRHVRPPLTKRHTGTPLQRTGKQLAHSKIKTRTAITTLTMHPDTTLHDSINQCHDCRYEHATPPLITTCNQLPHDTIHATSFEIASCIQTHGRNTQANIRTSASSTEVVSAVRDPRIQLRSCTCQTPKSATSTSMHAVVAQQRPCTRFNHGSAQTHSAIHTTSRHVASPPRRSRMHLQRRKT